MKSLIRKATLVFLLTVVNGITGVQAAPGDVPLKDSVGVYKPYYSGGASFVFQYPDTKYPSYNCYCDKWTQGGGDQECLSSHCSWENTDIKKTGSSIRVYVYATEEEAQAALDILEQRRKDQAAKEFEKSKRDRRGDGDGEPIRAVKDIPVSGADAGSIREYEDAYTDYDHETFSEKIDGQSTCKTIGDKVLLRKSRIILSTSLGSSWCENFTGKYFEGFTAERINQLRQRNENNKKHYQLQKSLLLKDLATAIVYLPQVERASLESLTNFTSIYFTGKDYSDMSLAELIDSRVQQASPKVAKSNQHSLELRLAAMTKDEWSLAEMNPRFPDLVREWSNASDHWYFPKKPWIKFDRNKHEFIYDKNIASRSPFMPDWGTFSNIVNTHFLNEIGKRLENGQKLSVKRQKQLRLSLIQWGGDILGLQFRKDKFYNYVTARECQTDAMFRILELTGNSTGLTDRPRLAIEADANKLEADGKSTKSIRIRLSEQSASGETPLKGKTISLHITPDHGKIVGTLSAKQVTTDAQGRAEVIYTAPAREALPEGPVPNVEIVARSVNYDLQDEIHIDLYGLSPVTITAEHDILPAHPDYKNEITFRFENPDRDRGKEYKAVIAATSEQGRLANGPDGAGKRQMEVKAASGADNAVYYYWDGTQPAGQAVAETIKIEIPELDISGTISLSVGMDLAITSAEVAWKPPFQPYLTIPIKVFIEDRLHPDADLAKLFDEFKIEPQLMVRQTGFTAPALFPADDKSQDALLSAVGKFIERSSFGDARATSLSHDLVLATLKKTKQNQWLLMSKDLSGQGVTLDQAYPALIPYARGTYKVSVAFDPRFKGDAGTANHEKALAPIDVSQVSARQGELEYFLLPTLKGVAGLTNAGGLAFGLTDIALKVRSGNCRDAIIDAGAMLAGKLIGDRLGGKFSDAIKEKYIAESRAYYKKMVAKALGKAGKAVPLDQEKLALQLARPYKLAAWVETLTGWAVDQKIGDMTAPFTQGSLSPGLADPNLMARLASLPARFASFLLPSAVAATAPKDSMNAALEYLTLFTKGYGSDYGVVVVTRAGLDELSARDASGQQLKQAPDSVFGGENPLEMIKTGRRVVVIPFKKGSHLVLDLKGHGPAVKVYKILDGKLIKGELDFQGQSWTKQLKVNG